MNSECTDSKPEDPLRDSWLRYLAYGAVIEEHFRNLDNGEAEPTLPQEAAQILILIADSYFYFDLSLQIFTKCQYDCSVLGMILTAGDTIFFHILANDLIASWTMYWGTWIAEKIFVTIGADQDTTSIVQQISGVGFLLYFSSRVDAISERLLDISYANEVGEAFRPLVPRTVVRLSYGVATTYVLADVATKTQAYYKENHKLRGSAVTALDVFLWQMFASVLIPGFTINRITTLSTYLITKSKHAPKTPLKLAPTVIGLLSIPIIIKPIDEFVTYFMDNTYRKAIDP